MSNRLVNELSPYLLQHANNPVDWYSWGESAFSKARLEAKPIFLSIGYSTCHWCHVMEHESFENQQIAEILNEHFISIKVDREERPDVDRVYMAFVQATTGAGGWPMSVWLTPDLKPFFGGTYFPPGARGGRPGFSEILRETVRLWNSDRNKLIESADTLMVRLRERQQAINVNENPDRSIAGVETLSVGLQEFHQVFDAEFGGFGGAPKFPRPSELLFLFREAARTGNEPAVNMAVSTLRAMTDGGMRDHIGGGFHRYSVDHLWRIPHFEKMLYDQAQLTLACLEAGQLTGNHEFLRVAADTLSYVSRDLLSAEGGFYSAEDADSIEGAEKVECTTKKSEGAFYLWRDEDIADLLGVDAEIARCRFGIEPGGNAPQDPTGEFNGQNQLFLAQSQAEVARRANGTVEAVEEAEVRIRTKLFESRIRRPRPHLDDKIVTAWNGLMIAANARAVHVFEMGGFSEREDRFEDSGNSQSALKAAQRAANFVREVAWDKESKILHRCYRDGRTSVAGYCEDYAYLIWGLLELFQVDGQGEWLQWALELQDRQDELFWDTEDGGWFNTTDTDASVLLRMKDDYDGAEPSAGSVSAMNLLVLWHLTGNNDTRDRLIKVLGRFGPRLGRAARVIPFLNAVLSAYYAGMSQIVVVGDRESADTIALRREVASRYLPFAVRVLVEPGASQVQLGDILPFVSAMEMIDGKATAYVCSDFSCQEPVTSPETLGRKLEQLRGIRE